MSEEKQSLQQQADRTRPSSRKPVLVYLVILFAAAFILLLLAFFMQKRANEVAIDNLEQSSHSAAESLENLIAERDALKEEAAALQAQLDNAEMKVADLGDSLTRRTSEVSVLYTLYNSEIKLAEGDYAGAAAEMTDLEYDFFVSTIQACDANTSWYNPDAMLLRSRFDAIVSALIEQGVLDESWGNQE